MRLWIAVFLISLFAFQALPVTALGKCFAKAKVAAGASSNDESGDEDSPVPEPGKMKKSASPLEDYYIQPALQRLFASYKEPCPGAGSPEFLVTATGGHARLHTPPPDRH